MDVVLLLRAHTDGQEVLGAGLSDYSCSWGQLSVLALG